MTLRAGVRTPAEEVEVVHWDFGRSGVFYWTSSSPYFLVGTDRRRLYEGGHCMYTTYAPCLVISTLRANLAVLRASHRIDYRP